MILGRLSLTPMTRARLLFFVLLGCCAISAFLVFGARAATPGSGTISDANRTVTYTSGPFFVSNPSAQSGSVICNAALPCDDFNLTISAAIANTSTKQVRAQVAWPNTTADFDMYVLDSMSNTVATSASSADPETVILPATAGNYVVRVVPFNPLGQSITGTITLENKPQTPPPGQGPAPRYQNYAAPNGLGTNAGEPSLGVDWRTEQNSNGGTVMYEAVLQTLRVTFDISCTAPIWQDVSSPYTSIESLDPILFTDHNTGRTFVSQLTGQDSASAITDDDGNTYTPSQGGGIPSGVDHQTIGAGPYSPIGIIPPTHVYTDAVYYCSQDIGTAFCARSDDGGITYNNGVPLYNISQCGGLHGHVKVAPDGTVYVPNKSCGAGQGVAVSDGTDPVNANGNGFVVRTIPNSASGDTDPSIGIASDGTIYDGFQAGSGDSHPMIAVSHDQGRTWSTPYDVGAQLGILNAVFPEVVGGDPNRAAFAFVGTTTGGNYQDAANFTGVWHLYIATTYDGGATWTTVDATPTDPVQRGSICTAGTTCGNDRNLLDFNDITIDKEGRVLVAYADGCIGSCVQGGPNSFSALATISRQVGGHSLFAAYDNRFTSPTLPGAPIVTATRQSSGVYLSWTTPDNGGATITSYEILRGTTPGGETHLITITGNTAHYIDVNADPNTTYYYQVRAINSVGEGPACSEALVTAGVSQPESPCVLPGITVATDQAGDASVAAGVYTQQLDLLHVYTAEPFSSPSQTNTLAFTIKVANLSTLPPSASWKALFNTSDGTVHYVSMDTTGAAPTYSYGTVSGTTENRMGAAATGSGYSPDGTITIVVTDTAVITNATPIGQVLSTISGKTQMTVGVLLTTIDTTDTTSGSFTVHGNQYCAPNTAPVAQLSATPVAGNPPLTVNFNGSGSHDPDPGDTIASYIFDFGDGSTPVTQTAATASHVYTQSGNYPATLMVTDSRGKLSSNIAQAVIEVASILTGTATPTGTIVSTGTSTAQSSGTATAAGTATVTRTPGAATASTTATPNLTPSSTATSIIPLPTVTLPINLTPSVTPAAGSTTPTGTRTASTTATTLSATLTATRTASGTSTVTRTPGTVTATTTPNLTPSSTATSIIPLPTVTLPINLTPSVTQTAGATDTSTRTASATITTTPILGTATVTPTASGTAATATTQASATTTSTAEASATGQASTTTQPSTTTTTQPSRTVTTQPVASASATSTTQPGASATATMSPTVCPIQFADVPASGPGSTFYVYARCLVCRGIVSGYPCGGAGEPCNANHDPYYRPGANVTRGQLSKIISNAAGLSSAVPATQRTYSDVPNSDPFWVYIERLSATGAISGYPCGTSNPQTGAALPCDSANRPYFLTTNNATRGQIAKIVSITAGFNEAVSGQSFSDVPPTSPFYQYIQRLSARHIIDGYDAASGKCAANNPPYAAPCFLYNTYTTRGQMAKIAANAFFPNCQTPSEATRP